ncbi:aspartate kinase [Orbus hercynius]|uniref:Aspartokinase n=1 Tax=Orbus hercynius TaxID=593135 RepID=A0A495RCZ8_9GAMM|nr:lysine-sensitive aspartokinase 3 [Orbus hercynius]RKS85150.1 aspartate kinase [Orbus hercynius]
MNSSNQSCVIAKFGGTSVADYEAMKNSANIVLTNPDVKVVVLSASAGVTNLLVALAEGRDTEIRQQHLAKLHEIQYNILSALPANPALRDEIDQVLNNIASLSEAASLATSAALTDELVSHGELMSSRLFVEILKEQQQDAIWFDVRRVIRTDNKFGKAIPQIDEIKQLCCAHLKSLAEKHIVVTQGFIGSENSGKTTTLGRGGSDYTAALLGEALHASQIDIWTDVAGIYTTDPRIVPNAKRIDDITFAEAAEMATFGAKVLHPATLVPAVRSNIPVFVGSSKNPQAGGTIVYNAHSITSELPLFRSVSLRRKQTLLTLNSLNMLHAQGFLANVFTILAKHNISVDLVTTSEVSVALTIDTAGTNTDGSSLLTKALLDELSTVCCVEVQEDLALIAIIGNHLTSVKGMTKQIFGQLEDFSVRLSCFGASTHNICFLVKSSDADSIVKILHKAIFE